MNFSYFEKKPIIALLIFLVLGSILYYPTTAFEFLLNFDDDQLILNNPQLQGLTFLKLKEIFTEAVFGLYHPVTTLSWAIEYSLFGLDPYYFHLNNIVLHLINAILVFYFIQKLLKNKLVALFCSLLFIIHPMHVENVAWLSSRKDLVYTFFFLLGLIQYLRYKQRSKVSAIFLTSLFFILSLFSKSNAVVFPAVLLLIDLHFDKKVDFKSVVSKVPFFLLSALFVYITIHTQSEEGFIKDFEGTYNWINRIFMAFYSPVYYLFKLIIPIHLFPKNLYPQEVNGFLPFQYYLGLPALILLAVSVWLQQKSRRIWILGLGFFLIIILPVLKIIPTGNDLVSNRYVYLPYLGLYMIWGSYLFQAKNKWLKILSVLLVLFFLFQSYNYQSVYKNSYSTWSAVIESAKNTPEGKAMALNERGQTLMKQEKYKAAYQDISKALKLNPNLYRGLLNRAIIYDMEGKYEAALADLNLALKEDSSSVDARKLRGMVYAKSGQAEQALIDLTRALELDNSVAELYNNRGIANSMLKNFSQAKKDFDRALRLSPNNLEFMTNKARLHLKIEEFKQAIAFYETINKKNSSLETSIPLAIAYLKNNEEQKAKQLLNKYKSNAQVSASIGQALLNEGYSQMSIFYFNQAMQDKRIQAQMQYMIAQANLQMGETQKAIQQLTTLADQVKDPQLYFEVGELYKQIDNTEKACEYWSMAATQKHLKAQKRIKSNCQ
jgi:tetratricopeptide (TPR) repeat protein